jgi:quercetin dioxygenase-like cupin family protein
MASRCEDAATQKVSPPPSSVQVVRWRDVPTQSAFAGICHQRFDTQNATLVQYVYQPGSVYPPHSHPEEQVTVVLRGDIQFEVAGRLVKAEPGTLLVIPPWVVHGARVLGDVPVECLNLLTPRRTQAIVYEVAE